MSLLKPSCGQANRLKKIAALLRYLSCAIKILNITQPFNCENVLSLFPLLGGVINPTLSPGPQLRGGGIPFLSFSENKQTLGVYGLPSLPHFLPNGIVVV